MALLAFPVGANLDTGNINLLLTLMLWAAQFTGPRLAGLLWALATWMKWVPGGVLVRPRPRARGLGLVWLCLAILLSIALLPLTIQQFQALFGFGARPIRLDYLVYLWAFVPWLYRRRPATPTGAACWLDDSAVGAAERGRSAYRHAAPARNG